MFSIFTQVLAAMSPQLKAMLQTVIQSYCDEAAKTSNIADDMLGMVLQMLIGKPPEIDTAAAVNSVDDTGSPAVIPGA